MKINNTKQTLVASLCMLGLVNTNAQTTAVAQEPGINLGFMDKSIQPTNDFYRFVNGTWLDNTAIPSDRTCWGSFDELSLQTDKDALAILKEAASNPQLSSTSDQGKAVSLYLSILDTVGRNRMGIAPLHPYLKKINSIKTVKDLENLLIEMEPQGGIGLLGLNISADAKDSNRNAVYLYPGSVGLPDRDYYMANDDDSKEKRAKYVLHVARMLGFLGENKDEANAHAKAILKFETEMSAPRLDRVELRDTRKSYNPMTIADLQKLSPSIDWSSYFTKIGITKMDTIIVSQPKYMVALDGLLKTNRLNDLKAYLRWSLLNRKSSELTVAIEDADWDFYSKTLSGAMKQRPREEEALQIINDDLGEALGKLYVEKKFPAEAKAKAEKMIKNVILAFENRINNLSWMSTETKRSAIQKLNKSIVKIGYPDKWKDYSALTIVSPANGGSFFENNIRIAKWQFAKDVKELHDPVDKTTWGMSPQTVNAYYNPSYNEIVFPAAILQPPFYNYQADEAVNYGGIGAVIGHEISHGFDDAGSRYDADGNLVNWWTEEDSKQFSALTGALADQYSALEPVPGTFVDGKFTLGENIGDLGGINAAYDGLQLYLKENKNPGLIDGYTPEQRFFISWATIWRSKSRDEALKNQVKTDPHSPASYRGYVPLQNVDAFYDAFNIQANDGMYIQPDKRVKIW